MSWDDDLKEVFFNKYCANCKHLGVAEELEPCYECLAEPVNIESHKPVKYEERERETRHVERREVVNEKGD